MRMIVLAAGQGTRLRPLTDECPKAMVPFMGRPLLDWSLTAAVENGLTEPVVIGGYRWDRLPGQRAQVLKNPDYASTSVVGSLMVAEEWFGDGFVMSYGDIAYRPEVLRALLASPAEISVVVDLDWQSYWERRFGDPLQDAQSLRMTPDGTIRSIGQTVSRLEDVQAQYIGLAVFRGRGVKALRRAWARAKTDAAYRRPILGHRAAMAKLDMTDVLDELAVSGEVPVKAIGIHGGWVDIDRPEDIAIGEERLTSGAAKDVIDHTQVAPMTGVPAGMAGLSRPSSAAVPTFGGAPAVAPLVVPTIFRSSRRW
jgi:L-glutamine-phosphate cytidylyltransferase